MDPAASETSRTGCGLVKPVRRETQGHSRSNDELPSNSVSFVVFNVRRKNKLFRLLITYIFPTHSCSHVFAARCPVPSCGVRLSVTFVYRVETAKYVASCYGSRIGARTRGFR